MAARVEISRPAIEPGVGGRLQGIVSSSIVPIVPMVPQTEANPYVELI